MYTYLVQLIFPTKRPLRGYVTKETIPKGRLQYPKQYNFED